MRRMGIKEKKAAKLLDAMLRHNYIIWWQYKKKVFKDLLISDWNFLTKKVILNEIYCTFQCGLFSNIFGKQDEELVMELSNFL